jgi:hypothetical protein
MTPLFPKNLARGRDMRSLALHRRTRMRRGWVLLALLAPALSHAGECSEAKPERFGDFFAQFSTDTQFAQSRTVLPLLTERWNDDDGFEDPDEPLEVWVTREAYAKRPSLANESRSRHLVPLITLAAPTAASVELRDPFHGAAQALHFKLDLGCWRLWRVDEFEPW